MGIYGVSAVSNAYMSTRTQMQNNNSQNYINTNQVSAMSQSISINTNDSSISIESSMMMFVGTEISTSLDSVNQMSESSGGDLNSLMNDEKFLETLKKLLIMMLLMQLMSNGGNDILSNLMSGMYSSDGQNTINGAIGSMFDASV